MPDLGNFNLADHLRADNFFGDEEVKADKGCVNSAFTGPTPPRNILAFDCETTGLDKPLSRIDGEFYPLYDAISIAFLVIKDFKVVDKKEFRMKPLGSFITDTEALKLNGISINEIMSYKDERIVHDEITDWLGKYIDKYDSNDKFFPMAYNCGFDDQFLRKHFTKCGDKYLGSFINNRYLDPRYYLHLLYIAGVYTPENFKLATVAKDFDIKIDAHNALSDTEAMYKIFLRCLDYLSHIDFTIFKGLRNVNQRRMGNN